MHRSIWFSLFALTLGCNGDGAFVAPNIAPVVTFDSPDPESIFTEGQPILFEGRVRDDGPVGGLNIEWESSIDGALIDNDPPDPDGLVELITSNLTSGTHVITLRATDSVGGQGEDSIQIEVEDLPDIPSIIVINPDPAANPPVAAIEDQPFTFQAEVSDSSDSPDQLEVSVNAVPGGLLCTAVPDGSGSANCVAALPLGTYAITFTVVDSEGFSADANTSLTVREIGDVDQDGDGHTPNGGDCNDSSSVIYPGAPEQCDGLDNDCNDLTGIDIGSECSDDDMDGFCEAPPCINATSNIPDCNDVNPGIYPQAPEECNGIDDNCDGQIDEGLDAELFYFDGDGDGYGAGSPVSSCDGPPAGHVADGGDCDDLNAQVNPGQEEIQNGIDDNCNGQIDEAGPNFDDDGDGYCEAPPCTNASQTQPDCDDGDAQRHPGLPELCGDGIDNNCDGNTNEQNAIGCVNFFNDLDNDTYGAGGSQCWCEPSGTYAAPSNNDCDDNSNLVYPGQTSFFGSPANGSFDYNCDGATSPRYTSTSSGCQVAGLGCNGSDGWTTGIPQCGQAGQYQSDCGLDIGALLIGCGSSCLIPCINSGSASCAQCILSACPSSQVCEADFGSPSRQECR